MKRRDFIKSAIAAVAGVSESVKAVGAKKISVDYEPDTAPTIADISPEMSMGLYMRTICVSTSDTGTYPDFIV